MWTMTWQLACLAGDVPNVGDFIEYQVSDISVLIVRGEDGVLRAHRNVCQHRGRRIKQGRGCTHQLQCPYHGWTWDLEGRLKDVPERATFCEFDDASVALGAVRLEQWNDWVFVNLELDAEPLEDYLRPVVAVMEPFHFERQYRWHNKTTTLAANWKNTADAFQEAYHARFLHAESNAFLNYEDYEVRTLGDHSMMIIPTGLRDPIGMPYPPEWEEVLDAMEWSFDAFGEDTTAVEYLRQMELGPDQQLRDVLIPVMGEGLKSSGIDISDLDPGQVVDDWHFFIFPNVLINSFSFGSWLFRILPNGDDPNSSIIDMWYFHRVPEGTEMPTPVANEVVPEGEPCGAVMDQDLRNIPKQQQGMRDPAFAGLRLSSLESRIAHAHEVLDRYLSA